LTRGQAIFFWSAGCVDVENPVTMIGHEKDNKLITFDHYFTMLEFFSAPFCPHLNGTDDDCEMPCSWQSITAQYHFSYAMVCAAAAIFFAVKAWNKQFLKDKEKQFVKSPRHHQRLHEYSVQDDEDFDNIHMTRHVMAIERLHKSEINRTRLVFLITIPTVLLLVSFPVASPNSWLAMTGNLGPDWFHLVIVLLLLLYLLHRCVVYLLCVRSASVLCREQASFPLC